MRLVGALGILCFVAAPAMAGSLHFDVIGGSVSITVKPPDVANPPTVYSAMLGSFDITITPSDHIGDSASVTVDDVDVVNTEGMETVLINLITAYIPPGSMGFSDFQSAAPGHLSGGLAVVPGSAYNETGIILVGAIYATFNTASWGPSNAVVQILPPSSAMASDTITAILQFDWRWEIGITASAVTVTLDFMVNLEGTAHVPEPALGSLVVLGLGGAGAWLRRRRS